MFKNIDLEIRRWLCNLCGHKFYVGNSGYYKGMSQSHCWRCGKSNGDPKLDHYIDPIGNWFN